MCKHYSAENRYRIKSAEILLNTKLFGITSVYTVLNVNTDVMLKNANTRKIYAVSYAQKMGREIIVIDPITRLISHGDSVPGPAHS